MAASGDLHDLRLRLRDLDRVPELFPEQCARQGRGVRKRPARGIGLILADDPEGLATSVVADDGHRRAEMHLAAVAGRSDELCARPPRGPVAQVARRARQRGAVVRRLGSGVLLLETRDFGLDAGEPLGGHEVRMRRNRPLRQLLDGVFQLFDECSAHESALATAISPVNRPVIIWEVDGQVGMSKAELDATTRAAALSGTISLRKSSFPLDAGIAFAYATGCRQCGAFGRMRCTTRRSSA